MGSSLGIAVRSDWGTPDFSIIGIGYHFHLKGDNEECYCRSGIVLTLAGIHITIGIFQS